MLKAIDLFSGAGGFLVALEATGIDVALTCELDKNACNAHRINFPNIPLYEGDIRKLSSGEIAKVIGNEEIDLLVGGPPCQGFSIFGNRRFVNTKGYEPKEDLRNQLVYEYIRIVGIVRPKYFVMENVKGFTSLDKGMFVQTVVKEFKKLGYNNIEYGIFKASDYGVPQHRERMIMIGTRFNQRIKLPEKLYGDQYLNRYRTVGEVIMDIADKSEFDNIPNHVPLKHKEIIQERMSYIKEGCKLNIDEVPEHLLIPTRKDGNQTITNYSHVYKRLHREKPSITLVPGHNAFPVHPTLNRTLTVREAARIQTFPDNHIFTGTRQQQCIQVGNAIPPLMAEAFIREIKKQINDSSSESDLQEYYAL